MTGPLGIRKTDTEKSAGGQTRERNAEVARRWALDALGQNSSRPGSPVVSVGIEGTLEPKSGRHTLLSTGHFRRGRWREDFGLVRWLGLGEVRYPIPWHEIERERGNYRWRRLDPVLASATEEHGLTVIADPLHHTSYPPWLRGGFLNPAFVSAYPDYVEALASRYERIRIFTPFNEPTCTLDFCGDRGFWHPYATGDLAYATMLRHTARGVAEAVHRIRRVRPGAFILHVDTFERHEALDRISEPRARFLNERRFIFEELITGRVDGRHPLRRYLLQHGFARKDLAWHEDHPVAIDERGGNYYPLNEEELRDGKTFAAPSERPAGFAGVVREYAERLSYPLSLTETNIQGTVRDRISWLKYMLEQSEALAATGVPLRRFAWYPLFDCAGWNSLLQGRRWKRDPQGIFSCDEKWNRRTNEFAQVYRRVADGSSSAEIPAYVFTARHTWTLRGLVRGLSWEWIDQEVAVDRECEACSRAAAAG